MLINSPHLPNIETSAETSRGKLSVQADLETADGRIALANLLRSAHVFVQGYRPGALQALGFGPQEAARLRPGIVYVSLSAYGRSEEHTSELQSLMRISYAVFCLKKKKKQNVVLVYRVSLC